AGRSRRSPRCRDLEVDRALGLRVVELAVGGEPQIVVAATPDAIRRGLLRRGELCPRAGVVAVDHRAGAVARADAADEVGAIGGGGPRRVEVVAAAGERDGRTGAVVAVEVEPTDDHVRAGAPQREPAAEAAGDGEVV